MATEKIRCRTCGDTFQLTQEEQDMKDDGYWSPESETCNDCFQMQNSGRDLFYEIHSDADPGL